MPQIPRHNLPPHRFDDPLDRVSRRNISADQLGPMANWLDTEPEAPDALWLKRFPGRTVCCEGELVRTILQPGQIATGKLLP